MGRPFSIFASGDPTNQGLRNALASYDGSSLHYNFDARGDTPYFNTAAFQAPDPGTIGNGRNVVRQPGISQLDLGIFKNFKVNERFAVKF
jgi:hypothetical protein